MQVQMRMIKKSCWLNCLKHARLFLYYPFKNTIRLQFRFDPQVCRRILSKWINRSSSARHTFTGTRNSATWNSSKRWCFLTSWKGSSKRPATVFVRVTNPTPTVFSCFFAEILIPSPIPAWSSSFLPGAFPQIIPTSKSSSINRSYRKSRVAKNLTSSHIPSNSLPLTAKTLCRLPITRECKFFFFVLLFPTLFDWAFPLFSGLTLKES